MAGWRAIDTRPRFLAVDLSRQFPPFWACVRWRFAENHGSSSSLSLDPSL